MIDSSGLVWSISQCSSGLSSNYDWRGQDVSGTHSPKSSLDSLSHSLAYLND